ncbi:MAG: hypothetical protein AB7N80_15555 [Bdellovibrionales bacterium]
MKFTPMRELPPTGGWKKGDVVVIFGELFSRGYANGLVDEARHMGLKLIFSTVGRRDEAQRLRPLNEVELAEKDQPLINIPLEAGFDLEPSDTGLSPVDQLQGVKLSEWEKARLDMTQVEQSRIKGVEDFRRRTQQYVHEVEKQIPSGANILFVHTMAGGVPRAKIVMPAMNRVFKGHGERYASSSEFWQTDMGKLCASSFMEVSANTLQHLIEMTEPLRKKVEQSGNRCAYVAYGYHGTDVLMNGQYQWQSYSPYLQGFAKIELENIAARAQQKGIRASVYNAPEILTNSSSIFLGVEVSLYPLLGALQKEGVNSSSAKKVIEQALKLLKPEYSVNSIMEYTTKYFTSQVIREWSNFPAWPQHNGPEQMAAMRVASTDLINMHLDTKNLITSVLSEAVFKACGKIMIHQSWEPKQPVWWLGHDIVAKQTAH